MIDKPKQYYDTRRHQLYYQWSESEYFYHQEPIYDRTKEYIESLEAENAKLRQQLADVAESMGRVGERCAKLRELVADMWPHVRYRSRMCGKCDLPCDTSDECLLYEPMRQRMRELGVEADG